MIKQITINTKSFEVLQLLGKGKVGYSYLVTDGNNNYVAKQIHHEPCSYYQFGNKLESEMNDYNHLLDLGITMPKMLDVDVEKECILKEYIQGETIYEAVKQEKSITEAFTQIKAMCQKLYEADTNIDYFPTNFILQDGILYYIDYEWNHYMDEWNFENWGIKYWSKTPEFLQYVQEHQA